MTSRISRVRLIIVITIFIVKMVKESIGKYRLRSFVTCPICDASLQLNDTITKHFTNTHPRPAQFCWTDDEVAEILGLKAFKHSEVNKNNRLVPQERVCPVEKQIGQSCSSNENCSSNGKVAEFNENESRLTHSLSTDLPVMKDSTSGQPDDNVISKFCCRKCKIYFSSFYLLWIHFKRHSLYFKDTPRLKKFLTFRNKGCSKFRHRVILKSITCFRCNARLSCTASYNFHIYFHHLNATK